MTGSELLDSLRSTLGCDNNSSLALRLGLTSGRISQIKSKSSISADFAGKLIAKISNQKIATTFREAIYPLVEFFPIELSLSRGESNYIPFNTTTLGGNELLLALKGPNREKRGVYAFYNSQGEIIYFGKTEAQTLYDEMINAFNRQMRSCNIYRVRHPWGRFKSREGEALRQIRQENVYLYHVASYFSAYSVEPELIGAVESLVIRLIPNDIINTRIEKKALSVLRSANL